MFLISSISDSIRLILFPCFRYALRYVFFRSFSFFTLFSSSLFSIGIISYLVLSCQVFCYISMPQLLPLRFDQIACLVCWPMKLLACLPVRWMFCHSSIMFLLVLLDLCWTPACVCTSFHCSSLQSRACPQNLQRGHDACPFHVSIFFCLCSSNALTAIFFASMFSSLLDVSNPLMILIASSIFNFLSPCYIIYGHIICICIFDCFS